MCETRTHFCLVHNQVPRPLRLTTPRWHQRLDSNQRLRGLEAQAPPWLAGTLLTAYLIGAVEDRLPIPLIQCPARRPHDIALDCVAIPPSMGEPHPSAELLWECQIGLHVKSYPCYSLIYMIPHLSSAYTCKVFDNQAPTGFKPRLPANLIPRHESNGPHKLPVTRSGSRPPRP